MILPDPKSEKIRSDRIGFGFGLVSDRICTSLIWTEKNTSKLEIFIAIFQLSVRIEAGFFRGFIEKLSVLKVHSFFRVLFTFAKYNRLVWGRIVVNLDIVANLM